MVGLAFVAFLASGAVAAVAAEANAPTWYECRKVAGGRVDKGCLTEGGAGGYEVIEGVGNGKPFRGKGKEVQILLDVVAANVVCNSAKSEGFYTAAGERKVSFAFSGCKVFGFREPCTSAGARTGEIKINPLEGRLGIISAVGPKVGVELTPEGGTSFTKFSCGLFGAVAITGGVIEEITGDISKFSKQATGLFESYFLWHFEGGLGVGLVATVGSNPPGPAHLVLVGMQQKGEYLEVG